MNNMNINNIYIYQIKIKYKYKINNLIIRYNNVLRILLINLIML
jgi:hypothetical protein